MCGIAGMFDTRAQRDLANTIETMTHRLTHRGPDAYGIYQRPGVALGHRRLSIIDLEGSSQPLHNEDGTVTVIFNGEIYNFKALREDLVARGHTLRTDGDTEVLVHAWEEWGEASVERLRGMFAYAIYDSRSETLFLARDRLGIKPLYWALLDDGTLIFGSELKALEACPAFPRDPDPLAIEEYFALGYVPEPRTIYRAAHKLEPGHTLTFKRNAEGIMRTAPRKYWDVSFAQDATLAATSEAALAEELTARIREAVQIRMVAEVPLGAFLSGGVDSSAVVAAMAGLSSDPVRTCSIGFDDPAFDEATYARQVARHCHTDHTEQTVDPDDFSLIDTLAELYDEPYADSSAMPTYRVCQLARQQVTVALSGDGGDENLAGYRRYRWHLHEERMRGLLPGGLRKPLFGMLAAVYPKADWAPKVLRAKSTFEGMARDGVSGYFHSVSIFNDKLRSPLFSHDFKHKLGGYQAVEVFRRHAGNAPAKDPLSLIQYIDLKTYLVGDILTKVDRASMAHSLEVRVPLLDHQLVDWISTLPPNVKLRGTEGKYLFKKSLEPSLPHDILYRKKMGFSVPLASWFRGPLKARVRDALTGTAMRDSGMFDMQTVTDMVDRHERGVRDFSATLWSLLMFEAWLRRTQ